MEREEEKRVCAKEFIEKNGQPALFMPTLNTLQDTNRQPC